MRVKTDDETHSSPPPEAAPVRRSGASAAAPCWRRHGAPGALWSELFERLHAHALSSQRGASAALPRDTRGRQQEDLQSASSSVHTLFQKNHSHFQSVFVSLVFMVFWV